MALFLVQHGRSAAKDIDPEKGLTAQGREETVRIARVAKGYDIPVLKVVHSGKKRAEQTAVIIYEELGLKTVPEKISGIAPLDDVQSFAATIAPQDNRLVVGHLPFMERLVSFLTTGSVDTRVYRFQNSGIVCLDVQLEEGKAPDWYIKWTLNPTIS